MSISLFARLHQRHGKPLDEFSRRDMLKATLAIGAGLIVSGPASAVLNIRPRSGARSVIVVGAGFAGLACAYELKARGCKVTVIEARNRVGGRVLSFNAANKSEFIPGKNIEGGGELIGTNHPLWMIYSGPDKFNLDLLKVTEDDATDWPVIIDGKELDFKASAELYEQMKAALSLLNFDAKAVKEDEPWNTPNAKALDARTTKDWLDKIDATPHCKAAIAAQLASNNGCRLESQSYLGNLTQIKGGGVEAFWTDSENRRCAGGNQRLALKFLEAIGPDRVVLRLPVRSIKTTDSKAVVTCADGRTIEADDVVLAVPPSVWSKITIEPGLPSTLVPQMGVAVKFLSHLKTRFWKDKNLSPAAQTDGPIGMTWDATDGQDGDPACLTVFSGGPAAETCRALPATDRDKSLAAALEPLYPGFKENLVASRFMDWPSEPFTLAGYSFPSPNQVTTMGPLLTKPHGRLHLAGEHICYKFIGYMEGGLQSGVAIANRLAPVTAK